LEPGRIRVLKRGNARDDQRHNNLALDVLPSFDVGYRQRDKGKPENDVKQQTGAETTDLGPLGQ